MAPPINENNKVAIIAQQQLICKKYGTLYTACPFDKMVGVALESFDQFDMPINGLRHPPESNSSANWYIWAGKYSDSDKFFKPVHVIHLFEICPKVLKFLGLPPGWRFLFDNAYEDVWYDENLLKII